MNRIIEVVLTDAGMASVRTETGKLVEAKPGQRLFISVTEDGKAEDAWVADGVTFPSEEL